MPLPPRAWNSSIVPLFQSAILAEYLWVRPFRSDVRSHDPSARRDPPYGLDAIVMDADDPLVEIDGGADMVRDDRDAIPDPKRPGIFSERQHAMLLPQARDPRRWIGREIAVAASRLPRHIGRERLAPGINDGAIVGRTADHRGAGEKGNVILLHGALGYDVGAPE